MTHVKDWRVPKINNLKTYSKIDVQENEVKSRPNCNKRIKISLNSFDKLFQLSTKEILLWFLVISTRWWRQNSSVAACARALFFRWVFSWEEKSKSIQRYLVVAATNTTQINKKLDTKKLNFLKLTVLARIEWSGKKWS